MNRKILLTTIFSLFLLISSVSADSINFQIKFIVPAPPPAPLNVPTTIQNLTGTLDSGNVTSTQIHNDGDTYNLSEVVGTPAWVVEINFTNFTNTNQLVLVHNYDGNMAHNINVDAWNGTSWVNLGSFTDTGGWINSTFNLDSSVYDVGGNISVRLNHTSAGNMNHDYSLDYAILQSTDLAAPTFDNLRNFTHTVNTSFSGDFDATDNVGVNCFGLNDTSVFNIDCIGTITNVTSLGSLAIYWLNVSVNDTNGNTNYGEFFINVVDERTGLTCRYRKLGYYDTRLSWLWEANCI